MKTFLIEIGGDGIEYEAKVSNEGETIDMLFAKEGDWVPRLIGKSGMKLVSDGNGVDLYWNGTTVRVDYCDLERLYIALWMYHKRAVTSYRKPPRKSKK